MKKIQLLFVLWWIASLLLYNNGEVIALSIGSNTVPSRQSSPTFTTAGAPNTILGFAAMEHGFVFSDNTTTCTFDDFMPIAEIVRLNGGELSLQQDLVISNSCNFIGSGSFRGNNYSIEFGKQMQDVVITATLYCRDIALVFNSNVSFRGKLIFQGNCKINAKGKKFALSETSQIAVRPAASLIFEDVQLTGVRSNNIQCFTDQGSITFKNALLTLSSDYTFSRGSILFEQDVIVTGTSSKFVYSSGLSSTIASGAMLFLDDVITLSYQPRRSLNNLINMQDSSSLLYLNGCTLYSTRTGLKLNTGTVIIDSNVTFTSEGRFNSEAMFLTSALTMRLRSGALLNLQGLIRYD